MRPGNCSRRSPVTTHPAAGRRQRGTEPAMKRIRQLLTRLTHWLAANRVRPVPTPETQDDFELAMRRWSDMRKEVGL